MREFLLFVLLFLAMGMIGCGIGRYQLVYHHEEFKVYNSLTGEECPKVYTQFDGSSVVYNFGKNCSVLLRYQLDDKLPNIRDLEPK